MHLHIHSFTRKSRTHTCTHLAIHRTMVAPYDATFSVFDFESMIWDAHAAIIDDEPNTYGDKYNDNHYAVDLVGFTGSSTIEDFCTDHYDEAFPINFPTTFFAWDCDQSYLIDPTGWSIQEDIQITLPGCGHSVDTAVPPPQTAA